MTLIGFLIEHTSHGLFILPDHNSISHTIDYLSPRLTTTMIQYGSRACFLRDKNGFLPAHIACSRHCSTEKLEMLLRVNPSSLYAKTNDGRTLLSLARITATKSHPNYSLIKRIERRVKMALTTAASPSTAMGEFNSENHVIV